MGTFHISGVRRSRSCHRCQTSIGIIGILQQIFLLKDLMHVLSGDISAEHKILFERMDVLDIWVCVCVFSSFFLQI